MTTEQAGFYFARLNHVSVNELEAALAATMNRRGDERGRYMFAYITAQRADQQETSFRKTPAEDLAALRLAEEKAKSVRVEITTGELADALLVWYGGDDGNRMDKAEKILHRIQTKRRMDRQQDKAEVFAKLWGAGPPRDDRAIDGQQTIKHNELVAALMHLGWESEPAHRTAYNITCRVLDEREPRWKPKDIVRSGSGKIFIRQAEGDWADARNPDDRTTRYQNLVGPLTKIGVAT